MFSREDNSFMGMNNQNQFMNNGYISAQPKGTAQNPIHEDNDILKQRANAFFSDKYTSQLNRKTSLSQLNPDVYRCLRRKIRFSRSLLLPFHPPIFRTLIST